MENNGKRFYLTIRGQEVEVSEEVYRAYIQPVRAERRRKQRAFRCKIKGERLNLVRCNKDCRECPYALSGHNALGNSLSLDRMKDEGVDIEDRHLDVEQNYIADEEKRELYAAIKKLTPRQKEIVRLIYFEEKTQEEAASIIGISHQAISKALKKILDELKSFF